MCNKVIVTCFNKCKNGQNFIRENGNCKHRVSELNLKDIKVTRILKVNCNWLLSE